MLITLLITFLKKKEVEKECIFIFYNIDNQIFKFIARAK